MPLGRARDGNDPRLLREQPRQRDLRFGRALAIGDAADDLHQRAIGCARFFGEARNRVAEVAALELRVGVDGAGEEPLAKRAEGHEADVQLFEGGQDLVFGFAPPERVLALQRGHGLYRVCATDGVDAGFGEPEVLHLALRDEVPNGACDIFDGHVGVHAVLVEEIDPVGPQALQAGVGDLADRVGGAVETRGLTVLEAEAELGGDDHLIADRLEGFTHPLLVREGPVDLRSVEEGDAHFVGGADHRHGLGPLDAFAVAEVEAHAAVAERGDFQASQCSLVHGSFLVHRGGLRSSRGPPVVHGGS